MLLGVAVYLFFALYTGVRKIEASLSIFHWSAFGVALGFKSAVLAKTHDVPLVRTAPIVVAERLTDAIGVIVFLRYGNADGRTCSSLARLSLTASMATRSWLEVVTRARAMRPARRQNPLAEAPRSAALRR
jgi:hypothetical protein